jgi:hypothetical protein
MIVEAGFFGLLGAAARKAWKRARAKLTPEEETIYLEALKNITGPDAPERFMKLSKWMSDHDHPLQAKILKIRADYLKGEQDPATRSERRAIISQAMQSTKVPGILRVASWFEGQTATGIARDLRAHAKDVEEGRYPPPETQVHSTSTNGSTVNSTTVNGATVKGNVSSSTPTVEPKNDVAIKDVDTSN